MLVTGRVAKHDRGRVCDLVFADNDQVSPHRKRQLGSGLAVSGD